MCIVECAGRITPHPKCGNESEHVCHISGRWSSLSVLRSHSVRSPHVPVWSHCPITAARTPERSPRVAQSTLDSIQFDQEQEIDQERTRRSHRSVGHQKRFLQVPEPGHRQSGAQKARKEEEIVQVPQLVQAQNTSAGKETVVFRFPAAEPGNHLFDFAESKSQIRRHERTERSEFDGNLQEFGTGQLAVQPAVFEEGELAVESAQSPRAEQLLVPSSPVKKRKFPR